MKTTLEKNKHFSTSLLIRHQDHNTKRAKLSIDVCAMFVAAKAIFSNFAIAHKAKRFRLRARQKYKFYIVWERARAMAGEVTKYTEFRSLSIMVF